MSTHSHIASQPDATPGASAHEHNHSPSHDNHSHGHHGHHSGHGHGHSHGGKEDSNKFMTGDRYWRWPGLRETALKTSCSVVNALKELGMSADELKKLDVLEVGCGGGAVTRLLAPTFGSISAIDIEPTMITSLHAHLSPTVFASDPTTKPSSNSEVNVTAFVHTITSKSPASFAAGDKHPSPTPSDPDRTIRPPAYRYDVAIIIMVLHHVENPDEFFAGLTGLLKEGGKVVVIEPNGLETVPPTGMHVKQEVEEGYEEMSEAELQAMKAHGHAHSHFFTVDKLSSAFEERGFKALLAKEDGTMPAQGVGRPEMKVGVLVAQQ